jgi:hypothetical protein
LASGTPPGWPPLSIRWVLVVERFGWRWSLEIDFGHFLSRCSM